MSSLPHEPVTSAADLVRCDARPGQVLAHRWLGVLGDYARLAKPRVAALVLATTAAGFYLAAPPGPLNITLLVHAVVGTACVAVGANALNHL